MAFLFSHVPSRLTLGQLCNQLVIHVDGKHSRRLPFSQFIFNVILTLCVTIARFARLELLLFSH